jgi:RNA polymerase sigma-70 factor (ECF subfamily)
MTTPTPPVSEQALIAHAQEGDRNAAGELFQRHLLSSLRVARAILRDRDEAEDAVQAAFLHALRGLGSFRGDASFKTWITRIVVNSCLLQLREKRSKAMGVHLEGRNEADWASRLAARTPTPEKAAWCEEIAVAFSRAVAGLPHHLREAYTLVTVSELPIHEAASSLGLTLAATKSRLFRARAGIRASLEPVRSGSYHI